MAILVLLILPTVALSYFIKPIWLREKRADFLNTKRPNIEGKISMKWKFGERN